MEKVRLLSYLHVRQLIGCLGITLSLLLWLGNFILCDITKLKPSISHYYYSTMGDVFVGVLFAIALFLYSYKGFDKNDDKITNLAALFVIITALFPTTPENTKATYIGTIHLFSASLFFITLAVYSIFWFTKSSGEKTLRKTYRNKIYRTCGVIMILSIAMIGLFFKLHNDAINSYHPTFWLETIGLCAFGTSWLVKGETILTDKKEE